MSEEGEALAQVLRALIELGIRYFIGGSVASALHGIPRATMDIDIVAEIAEAQVATLGKLLQASFYLDEDDIRLIHFTSAFKFDIFPAQRDPYHSEQMRRALASPVRLPFGVEAPAAKPRISCLRHCAGTEWEARSRTGSGTTFGVFGMCRAIASTVITSRNGLGIWELRICFAD